MLQSLTYSYLVAWILGGLMLLTIALMRSQRRPYWLSFGLIGYGAAGFLSLGLGLAVGNATLLYALLAGVLAAALGLGVNPIGRDEPAREQA